MGPNFEPPQATMPAGWLEAEADRARQDQPVDREWWRVLGSPELDRLVQEAYRQNLPLRVAGLRVLEARAQLGQSVGLLYPQRQEAGASLTYATSSERSPTASPAAGRTNVWQDSVSLSAAWELDFWGKYRRAVEAAEAGLQASVADYDSALVSLTANVASSYVLVRTYETRLYLARANLGLQEEAVRIAQSRLDLGATSERDLQQALTILRNTEAVIPELETGLRQARHSLCLLLGRAPSDLGEFLGESAAIPKASRQPGVSVPADLLRRRPDIRSAELVAAAQSARIGVAEAQLYPSFSLSGNIGLLASDAGSFSLGDLTSSQARFATFGPSLVWNLFNYGQIKNNVRVQDARFQEALEGYRNTILTALREVEDAVTALARSQDRAESLRASSEAASGAASLAFVQYLEGQTDFTTVLVAQQSLLGVQDNLAATEGNIALNLIALYRALGGGWELREGREFVPAETKETMARRTDWGHLLEEKPETSVEPQQRPGRYTPDW